VADGVLERGGQFLAVHELAHEEAEGFFGGHAARRGEGLAQEAIFCEFQHFVAHSGGAHIEPEMVDQMPRADRLGVLDIFLDNQSEDQLLAFAKAQHTLLPFLALSTLEC